MKIVFKNGVELNIKEEEWIFEKLSEQLKRGKPKFSEFQENGETHFILDIKEILLITK